MVLSFLPSFMIEPLPKARSIWVSAASRAFDLSMDELSTTRSAAGLMITLHMAKDSGADKCPFAATPESTDKWHCTLFVLSSQYVLSAARYWSLSKPVAPFENGSGPMSHNGSD